LFDTSIMSAAEIRYVGYAGEANLPLISSLIERELSEPYSIFTYRYFLNQWPSLCILVRRLFRCLAFPLRLLISSMESRHFTIYISSGHGGRAQRGHHCCQARGSQGTPARLHSHVGSGPSVAWPKDWCAHGPVTE
jgi:hypothetical protein